MEHNRHHFLQHKPLFPTVMYIIFSLFSLVSSSSHTATITKKFEFNVEWKTVSRLCHTKKLLTVNGEYPGPTIAVHEGDKLEINVNNRIAEGTTLHWHGIKQQRTAWADGPSYITQCPIKGGKSYKYKFQVINQRGTLLWHAHYRWQRASVYGAFIIYPRMPYPFHPSVAAEIPIIFGEWWSGDADLVEREMMESGEGPAISEAYTINGLPGPLYPCSNKDTFIQTVEYGKTYMLRVINAALNDELFFAIANHTMTVVEADAVYTKPFKTKAIMLGPGQTTNLLITANQRPDSSGMFAMSARPYLTSVFPFDNTTTVAFLKYKNKKSKKLHPEPIPSGLDAIHNHNLPEMTDTVFATKFSRSLRSLSSPEFPCLVPQHVDKRVVITISLNLQDCPANKTCIGFEGKSFFASMNNQSFVRPSKSLLQYHYMKLTTSEYSLNFPEQPPNQFNYTGVDPLKENMNTEFGTKVLKVPYGTVLEVVLQDTSFLNKQNHPIHIHGHNFFIVGEGFGNYNVSKDPENYNLVDPPERNTVAVPTGGWAALRLKADNPGVWFMHCHLEDHTSWGLASALIVENGQLPEEQLLPPPDDFPSC